MCSCEGTPTCCLMRSWKEAAGTAAWRWNIKAWGTLCTSSSSARPRPWAACAADSSRAAAKCPPSANPPGVCFFFVEAVGVCTRAERGTAPKGLVSRRGLGLSGCDMVALSALVMFSGCSCIKERRACLFSATKRGVPPAASHSDQHGRTEVATLHRCVYALPQLSSLPQSGLFESLPPCCLSHVQCSSVQLCSALFSYVQLCFTLAALLSQ